MARPNPSATGEAAVRARPAGFQVGAALRKIRRPNAAARQRHWPRRPLEHPHDRASREFVPRSRPRRYFRLVERHYGPVRFHTGQL